MLIGALVDYFNPTNLDYASRSISPTPQTTVPLASATAVLSVLNLWLSHISFLGIIDKIVHVSESHPRLHKHHFLPINDAAST